MSDYYGAQLRTQLAEAQARSARFRAAWRNARRRAAEYSAAVDHTVAAAERGVEDLGRIAHDQLTRAEQAEARIAAARAVAERSGIYIDGARRILANQVLAALDGPADGPS